MKRHRSFWLRTALVGLLAVACLASTAHAQAPSKPNILVIFADDIGWFNVSSYSGRRITNLLIDPFERQTGDLNRQMNEHKGWGLTPLLGATRTSTSIAMRTST